MDTEHALVPCCCCDWPVPARQDLLATCRLPMVVCDRCWDLYDFLVLRKFFILNLAVMQLQGLVDRLSALEGRPR